MRDKSTRRAGCAKSTWRAIKLAGASFRVDCEESSTRLLVGDVKSAAWAGCDCGSLLQHARIARLAFILQHGLFFVVAAAEELCAKVVVQIALGIGHQSDEASSGANAKIISVHRLMN